jgi:biotin synthase
MFRSVPARRIPLTRALATHASASSRPATSALRYDWKKEEIQKIYDTPLLELVFRAASVHREHNDATKVQLCTLMNIKSALHPP